ALPIHAPRPAEDGEPAPQPSRLCEEEGPGALRTADLPSGDSAVTGCSLPHRSALHGACPKVLPRTRGAGACLWGPHKKRHSSVYGWFVAAEPAASRLGAPGSVQYGTGAFGAVA